MRVRVRLFAACRETVGTGEIFVDVPIDPGRVTDAGGTVGSVFDVLRRAYPALEAMRERITFAVNAEVAKENCPLRDGDEVALIPPVCGGAPSSKGMFRVTDSPIEPGAVISAVRADRDGAIVSFTGVVRNTTMGRPIAALEYDAYPEMAEGKMREIGEEIEERWGLSGVAIVHRAGRLGVGEISVVVAIASPHRKEAFEACEYAMERLKSIVPIWKKDVWEAGGESWR